MNVLLTSATETQCWRERRSLVARRGVSSLSLVPPSRIAPERRPASHKATKSRGRQRYMYKPVSAVGIPSGPPLLSIGRG